MEERKIRDSAICWKQETQFKKHSDCEESIACLHKWQWGRIYRWIYIHEEK